MKTFMIIAGIVVIVVFGWLFLVSGHTTGDSGPGKALGLFQTEGAAAAGRPPIVPPPPPTLPPTYPGSSEDGGTSEGVAEDAPPPDEAPVEDDNAAEVNDDGQPTASPEPSPPTPEPAAATSQPEQPKPEPVVPKPAPEPQGGGAGYCDPTGKFYDLSPGQQLTDPEWVAKGPWRDADVEADGSITCRAPVVQTESKESQSLGVVELDLKRIDGTTKCGQYVALRFYPDAGGQSFIGYRTTCTTTPLTLAKSGNVCPVVRTARGLQALTPACEHAVKGEQMVAVR